MPDAQRDRQRLGRFRPGGGRAGVQAGGIINGPRHPLVQVLGGQAGPVLVGRIILKRGQDQRWIIGGRQLAQPRLVLDQTGQAAQDRDMAVRTGGDTDDQMRDLAGVPLDPLDELQHRDPVAADQPLVLAKPVRDRHARTEKGVRDAFARDHAVLIARPDAARRDEQLPRLADRIRLVGRRGREPDQLRADGRGWRLGGHVSRASPARLWSSLAILENVFSNPCQ